MSFCKLIRNVFLNVCSSSRTPKFVLNPVKIVDNTWAMLSFCICDGTDYCAPLPTSFGASDPFVFSPDLWSYIILTIRNRTPVRMETGRRPSEHCPDETFSISVDKRTYRGRGYSRNASPCVLRCLRRQCKPLPLDSSKPRTGHKFRVRGWHIKLINIRRPFAALCTTISPPCVIVVVEGHVRAA